MVAKAYYLPLDELRHDGNDLRQRVLATESTVSTWGPMQHGAPPSALLARGLDRVGASDAMRTTRVVVELLGAVPVGELELRARVVRPGRRVELTEAELVVTTGDDAGRVVARGSGWRMETVDTREIEYTALVPLGEEPEGHGETLATVPSGDDNPWQHLADGYLGSLEWSLVETAAPGKPGRVWVRPTLALVEGEEPSPVERLFCVADIANGIGSILDPAQWTFLNTDLSVHLHRLPSDDWLGISAQTSYGPDGVGTCGATLFDRRGAIGRSAQTVQLRRR